MNNSKKVNQPNVRAAFTREGVSINTVLIHSIKPWVTIYLRHSEVPKLTAICKKYVLTRLHNHKGEIYTVAKFHKDAFLGFVNGNTPN